MRPARSNDGVKRRSSWNKSKDKRDGQTFLPLPHVVLTSPGYRQASHVARSLLVDIAMQYSGHNNGKLVACSKYLLPLGWKSEDTITRARRELVDCGLLVETRKGGPPNRAGWYALSWLDLDQAEGLDIDPRLYQRAHRGSYMRPEPNVRRNGRTAPSGGVNERPVAPPAGASRSIYAPADGATRPLDAPVSAPPDGVYLEVPSALRSQRDQVWTRAGLH